LRFTILKRQNAGKGKNMLISMLKSKIHIATVTDTELLYEGSIAIDKELIEAAGLIIGEKVHVLNFNNSNRFETYVIEGGKGEISLKGPAAKLGKKGDKVIIIAYGHLGPDEAKSFQPKIVHVDNRNNIKK
jgi:aspartate 1-decarboxylase